MGGLENFAVLIRVGGVTGQLVLSDDQRKLFSRLILGTLEKANYVPTPDIQLPADPVTFPQ